MLQAGAAGGRGNATFYVALLRCCTKTKDLERGTRAHDTILRKGLIQKCSDALVTMYAKCGALAKAKEVFDLHGSKDPSTWTALIAGYTQNGQGHDALNYFGRMKHDGPSPNAISFTCALKACGSIGASEIGEEIHYEAAKQGLLEQDVVLASALVDMYAKCGALSRAGRVLEGLPIRDVISWTSLIAGYAEYGEAEQALNCYEKMQHEGLSPNSVTFACILKACATLKAADKGEKIHEEIARQGLLEKVVVLGTALVSMYAKCGALAKAQELLVELPLRDIISWNALIAGYVEHDQGNQALQCFDWMQAEGLSPNAATFACILKACGTIKAAEKGEKLYDEIVKQGLLRDNIMVGNALVGMLAKCGDLTKARQVLEELPVRDVVSWIALIGGYVEQGKHEQALDSFEQMLRDAVSPNAVVFACILKACGSIRAADRGQKVHDEISKRGLLENDIVLGNALVDMYVKCGALVKAHQILEELPVRNVISWTTLIAGYADSGEGERALKCLEGMHCEGLTPDVFTYTSIVKACGCIGAAGKGEKIYHEIAKQGLEGNETMLGNAVVGMYAKCGDLGKAQQLLEGLQTRNTISWTAVILGYVQQGKIERALTCFKRMQQEGLSPSAATFSCVLSACSHVGLLEEAQMHFMNMSSKYGLQPDLEQYTCMIDLYGRAGQFDKAVGVIEKMPCFTSGVWCALLGACRKWGDVHMARWAFEQAIQVDRTDGSAYALMANIYAAASMQTDAQRIDAMRVKSKARKRPMQDWQSSYTQHLMLKRA